MILIAPAKSLKEPKSSNKKIQVKHVDKVLYLIKEIQKLSKDEMSKLFKIKNEVLEKTYKYYTEYNNNYTKEAILMYNGISYKQIVINQKDEITENKKEYLENRVFIISTLYGLVNSTCNIKPYRLDFTNSKIINGSLYSYWKETVNEDILNIKPHSILNLTSKEYSKILSNKLYSEISVYEISTEDKVTSVQLKKIRGQILNYCIENKVHNYDDLIGTELPLIKIIKKEGNTLIYKLV